MSDAESGIDRHVPHAARIYDYMVGGKDHFQVDRDAAHAAHAGMPDGFEDGRRQVRANRDFLVRVTRYLAGEAGIRQFLDIGTGVPGVDNVHAVAKGITPDARVVYVDNDPSVLAHARQLLADDGTTTYIDGDLRHPSKILREARNSLDFDRPVAVVLNAVLHFVPDSDGAYDIVTELVDAVPPGSWLAISHLTDGIPAHADGIRALVGEYNRTTNETWVLRSHDEVSRFFDRLELIEPGVVPLADWRPDRDDLPSTSLFGGVARKP